MTTKEYNSQNVTGINRLSIGRTKNDRGYPRKRYLVSVWTAGKNIVTSFYFGKIRSQKNAYDRAVCFMIENGLVNPFTNFDQIYVEYQHEQLI